MAASSSFSKFSEETFDPKDWINSALRSKDPQQGLDAHASTLVMKLQMFIQEVNNALEETSLQAVQSLPRVLHDVEAVRQEAQLLREQMQIVKDDIRKVEEETHQSMKHLLQLDSIKCRMQDAKAALEQAGKWANHVSEMDSVFSSQPPHEIANKLAAMRASLDVLRDVSDYQERVALLDSYSNRLEAQLSTPLLEAFNSHSLDSAKEYADMFTKIGRSPQLESYYIRCHKVSLTQSWTAIQDRLGVEVDSDKRNITHWLAQFYDDLLSVWHTEIMWCQQILPSPSSVLCSLFSQTLSNLRPSVESCVAEQVKAADDSDVLPQLIAIRDVTLRFAKQLEKSLSTVADSDNSMVLGLADVVHQPYLEYLLKYEDVEKRFLLAMLANIRLDVLGVMDTVRWVADSVPKVFDASEMALQHCISFTTSFGAPSLLHALEHFFQQYCTRVSSVISSLRLHVGLDNNASSSSDARKSDSPPERSSGFGDRSATDEDWSQLHNGVKLIEACGEILVHSETFEERLRVTLSTRCSSVLTESTSQASTPTSSTAIGFEQHDGSARQHTQASPSSSSCLSCYSYMANRQPEKQTAFRRLTSRLQTLTSASSTGALLPTSRHHILQLNEKAHLYAYDVIMSQLRMRLADVANLAVWSSMGDSSSEGGGASVPMFSLAPQDYIQHVTECLLSLPQELEHLGSSDINPALLAALQAGHFPHTVEDENSTGDSQGHNFADQWLGCFARGLLELFVESVLKIRQLSAYGSRQLLADITYLCKVIDAFGVSPSDDLQHLSNLLSASTDSYGTLATTASPQLFARVAAMRSIAV
eukprot:scpid36155/ scgid4588/ Conserved oligomeric Golgi complex subunit 7; Component of oligomeric Golgi complex 7